MKVVDSSYRGHAMVEESKRPNDVKKGYSIMLGRHSALVWQVNENAIILSN